MTERTHPGTRVLTATVALLAASLTGVVGAAGASAHEAPHGGTGAGTSRAVGTMIGVGTSARARDLPTDDEASPTPSRKQSRVGSGRHHVTPTILAPRVVDTVRQRTGVATRVASATSFEGISNLDGVVPPDTDGAVGPSHYVELVNQHYQVFDKTGRSLAGPTAAARLWDPFANATNAAQLCSTSPGGDGIVLYDRGADRWLVSQLAFANGLLGPTGPYVECFAVSQTSDPTGAFSVFALLASNTDLPDYPKIGIAANSYYLSANMFSSVFATSGLPEVWAFDRPAMLAVPPGSVQYVTFAGYVPSSYNTILPADVDGPTQPPAGSPEVFAGLDSSTNTTLGLWQLNVDWSNPGAATFAGPTNLTVAPYNVLCAGTQDCIAQPNTTQLLDGIGDRVMYRLAYRNFGDHEAYVVNHSVNVAASGIQAGVRWYEIDRPLANGKPSGGFTVAQQGTFAPNTTSRWMGSAAMDRAGDLAIGYSAVNANTNQYPSVMFTGRLPTDPPGQMTFAEGTVQAGGGAQTGFNRWGDYTRLALDPVDDCTFWYVGEYYSSSSASNWQTRIGSFKLSSCVPSPDFSLSAAPAGQSAVQGTGATYGLTVTPTNGFNSAVALAVTGLPNGATATLSPASTTSTSTMQISLASNTPIGTSTLTITATSGTLTHATTVTLTVAPAGDFSISVAPSTATVAQGKATSYGITVTPLNGFNSAVALAVGGLPSSASASFSPASTTSSSTLAVNTASNTTPGTYTLTVTGTTAAIVRSTTVTLVVTANTSTTVMHIPQMVAYGQINLVNWQAWGTVTITDQNNQPVTGATVTFTFTRGTNATRRCVTDSTGSCSTYSGPVLISLNRHSETVTASKVTKSGARWDGVKSQATLTK